MARPPGRWTCRRSTVGRQLPALVRPRPVPLRLLADACDRSASAMQCAQMFLRWE